VKNDINTTLNSLVSEKEEGLTKLQIALGYQFIDTHLLLRSMTHRSFIHEQSGAMKEDNETMEFLGDAVLDLVISNFLIMNYPSMDEGQLTKVRSSLVQEKHLAFMARSVSLGDHILLGKGEDCSKGREKSSILACAYEAVVGAIFMDGGYEKVCEVIEDKFRSRVEQGITEATVSDSKSRLQEITQAKDNEAPVYNLDKTEGPDHAKIFTVSVYLKGELLATATARSKKSAEQKAAAKAIENI
jgi:ribonuclease-3